MRTDAPDPKMIVLEHEGTTKYQVVAADGHAPDLAELQELARAEGGSGRFFMFVLTDESPLRQHGRPEDGHRVDLSSFAGPLIRGDEPVPLVLGDDPSLRIGVLESLYCQGPGDVPETEGRCLVGLGQLADSPLARCASNAMRDGILDSVCAVFVRELEDNRAIWGGLQRINVVPRHDAGCAAARILWRAEDPLTAA